MFPRSVRTGGAIVANTTKSSSLWLYHFIKSTIWITTTSAILLALPVAIEMTQIQAADEMKKVRQEKLFAK